MDSNANAGNIFATPGQRNPNATISSDDIDIVNDTIAFGIEMPLPTTGIEVGEIALPKSKAEFSLEAFMAEIIEISLSEPNTEFDPIFAELQVNGDYVKIPRDGETHKCRRYHLEVLARAKHHRVQQKKVVNADGSMGFEDHIVFVQTYPFQVHTDPHPRGRAWLKSIQQRAA